MSKKKKYKPDVYSSCSTTGRDTFSMVYDSLIKSEQFIKLPLAVKLMYYYCRNQLTSWDGKQVLYNHSKENGITYADGCFCFPKKHMEKYGINGDNGLKYIKKLVDTGFIDIVESNGHRKQPNVYRFSDRWKMF